VGGWREGWEKKMKNEKKKKKRIKRPLTLVLLQGRLTLTLNTSFRAG
jgi:hypothetical protein